MNKWVFEHPSSQGQPEVAAIIHVWTAVSELWNIQWLDYALCLLAPWFFLSFLEKTFLEFGNFTFIFIPL
jgi:hypothetical protein